MRGLFVIARRLLSEPLTVFVAVAAIFFIVYWAITRQGKVIEVPASVQASLSEDYALMTGHRPDAARKQKLIDDYVSDELLFREAIDRGIHLSDKSTKQRLIDRLRFLIAGAPAEPNEEQLINFYAQHTRLYRTEPRITLRHVFFTDAPKDPAAILAALGAGRHVAGDEFWMGRILPHYGESMIRGMFGQDFLVATRRAKLGEWVGPLRSPRGYHFVRVEAREAPRLMPYADVRDQVRQDYLTGESKAAVDAEVSKLEKDYRIDVEK
jgi:hypothetical protein